MHVVRYEVCSKFEYKYKLFVPKLDNLSKHINKRKAKVAKLDIQTWKFYFSKNSQHAKSKIILTSMAKENVFHFVTKQVGNDDKQKLVQFTYVMHSLRGTPPFCNCIFDSSLPTVVVENNKPS
jgi:hypothetical protein